MPAELYLREEVVQAARAWRKAHGSYGVFEAYQRLEAAVDRLEHHLYVAAHNAALDHEEGRR